MKEEDFEEHNEWLEKLKGLKDIDLSRQRMKRFMKYHELERLSQALKVNNSIIAINLEGHLFGDKVAQLLSQAIESNTNIKSFNLNLNDIGDEGAKSLSQSLKENKSITTFTLYGNQIGDEGVKSFNEVLKKNTTLTNLDLSGNQIGDKGAKYLGEALGTNIVLTVLNLWFNGIGDEGVGSLSKGLESNTTLTDLNLGDNQIGNKGAEYLSKILKTNNALTSLQLSNNQIGDQGIKFLGKSLEVNTTLTVLSLDGNPNGEKGVQSLIDALAHNFTLKCFALLGRDHPERAIESIEKYENRNEEIADCLKLIWDFPNQIEKIPENLMRLKKIYPDIEIEPDEHYLVEAYRLLYGLGYVTGLREAKNEVVDSLLPPFKNPRFQRAANSVLVDYFFNTLYPSLSSLKPEQKASLLKFMLFKLKDSLSEPTRQPIIYSLFYQLASGRKEALIEIKAFKERNILLNYDMILGIAKSLAKCKTNEIKNSDEIKALCILLKNSTYHPKIVASLFRLPTFLAEFKLRYPDKVAFGLIEQCLEGTLISQGQPSFFSAPEQPQLILFQIPKEALPTLTLRDILAVEQLMPLPLKEWEKNLQRAIEDIIDQEILLTESKEFEKLN